LNEFRQCKSDNLGVDCAEIWVRLKKTMRIKNLLYTLKFAAREKRWQMNNVSTEIFF